ncbi:MAG: hypothetical protein HZB43_00360 [candidate division Zixibacteria bacterium]|nr:hypothetical protein [candidate division Zixibacteria bacterium]
MDRRPRNPRAPQQRPPRGINPFGEGNARAVAYDIAIKAFRGEERFEHIWKNHPGLVQLAPRDRALAVHIASGVLRQYRRLDAQARHLTSGKSSGLSDPVQWIMRLGLFQVIDCDRIPAHAAVSTAVDATKKVSHQGIAGLMNAVLRRAVREKETPPDADQIPPEAITWGERLSMPDWMAEVLLERYGRDAGDRIARWANAPPHYYFRLSKSGAGLDRVNEILKEMHLAAARPHRELPEYIGMVCSKSRWGGCRIPRRDLSWRFWDCSRATAPSIFLPPRVERHSRLLRPSARPGRFWRSIRTQTDFAG